MAFPWIILSLFTFLIILGLLVVFLIKQKGKKSEPDYYTFFTMGIIWTGFGLIFWKEMSFFLIMGLVFLAIGLANKDKWKKNHESWKKMNAKEKKITMWIMIILGILVLGGLAAFLLFGKDMIYC